MSYKHKQLPSHVQSSYIHVYIFQVVARHEDLLAQATGIESLEGKLPLFHKLLSWIQIRQLLLQTNRFLAVSGFTVWITMPNKCRALISSTTVNIWSAVNGGYL